jgi:hypothetical protein
MPLLTLILPLQRRPQGVVLLHAAGPQVPQRVPPQPRRREGVLEGHWTRQAGRAKAAGIKKALVFYSGKAPRGVKTDWIIHEYRLADADRAAPGNKATHPRRSIPFHRRCRSWLPSIRSHLFVSLRLQLDEWVLCRLYNKKTNWEKVEAEEFHHEQGAAPHHRHEVDASDSFQTHGSEIDNNASGTQNGFGGVAPTVPNGAVVTVKEDNDWFTDMDFDALQASYMDMAQMVNPNLGQQAVNPRMRMWQTIMPL